MILGSAAIAWLTLASFVISLALLLIYLFLKDHDMRKIMVALGILPSSFSFLYLALSFPLPLPSEHTVFFSLFLWGVLPLLLTTFIIFLDRLLYKKTDFKVLFLIFTFLYLLSCLVMVIGGIDFAAYQLTVLISSVSILMLGVYFVLRVRKASSVLFLLAICAFSLGGYSLNIFIKEPLQADSTALPISCFYLGYMFLTLIFSHSVSSPNTSDEGIDIYFTVFHQLKKVEEALEESQQRYRWVIENFHQGIFLTDQNAALLYTNKFFTDMLGYTSYEMHREHLFDFIDDTSKAPMNKALHLVFQKQTEECEITLLKKDHSRLIGKIIMTPFFEGEKSIGILATVQDITKNKQMESELQEKIAQQQKSEVATLNIMEDLQESIKDLQKAKAEINSKNEALQTINAELNTARDQLSTWNQELEKKVRERTDEIETLLLQKDDFINQLGHDLKTPLTPLNTLIPLLKQRQHDAKTLELLDVCIGNVNYMKNLVIKTLELARLNSPTTTFSTSSISLLEELDEVLQRKQPLFLEHHVKIDNHIDDRVIVEADPLQIKEVFDNLIINAVKYSKPEGTVITINATEEADHVVVSINDMGIGLTSKQLDQIFREFYKADQSRHDLESTGLGLPICKRIIEKHGGKIWAESPGIDKGSTFYFTLKKGKIKDPRQKTVTPPQDETKDNEPL